MARTKLFFWIGSDFYNCYLDETNYNKQETLISEELLSKIIFTFDSMQNYDIVMDDKEIENRLGESLGQRKALFCLEGTEPAEFFEYIKGQKATNFLAKKHSDMFRVDGKSTLLRTRRLDFS